MRRGFVAAMVGVTAALLIGLASISLAEEIGGRSGPSIETMGVSLAGVVGMACALATLLVLGARRRMGALIYGVAIAIGALFLVWASGRVPARPTLVLSASDRAPLREFHEGEQRGIEHPTLAFRLPHPTIALSPSEEVVEETRRVSAPGWAEAHQVWAFETADHDVSVMLDLSRADRADRAGLDAFDRAVTGPLESAGHRLERGAVRGADGCMREPFTAHLASGGRVDGSLFTWSDHVRALRLVVTVVSDGRGDWAQFIDDVTLACERE
jgi:hypothetical protein